MRKIKQISVLSGKGGTGKTSLVAAFATLAQDPVIADCDVDAANLYLVLHPENYKEDAFVSGHSAVIDYDLLQHQKVCSIAPMSGQKETNHSIQKEWVLLPG